LGRFCSILPSSARKLRSLPFLLPELDCGRFEAFSTFFSPPPPGTIDLPPSFPLIDIEGDFFQNSSTFFVGSLVTVVPLPPRPFVFLYFPLFTFLAASRAILSLGGPGMSSPYFLGVFVFPLFFFFGLPQPQTFLRTFFQNFAL